MTIKIKQQLVDKSKYNIKCPFSMKAEYITIHNTANDANASNEVKYHNRNNNKVSYHIAVDDIEAIQCVPFNRNAWHCGDGRGKGNMKSIGIEICYSKSGGERYKKAEENCVILTAQLLHERGWGIDRVKKHQDWSGKLCPHRILNEGRWQSFLNRVKKQLDKLNNNIMEDLKMAKVSDITSTTLRNSVVNKLKEAKKQGKFKDDKWINSAEDGSLSIADLLALMIHIDK